MRAGRITALVLTFSLGGCADDQILITADGDCDFEEVLRAQLDSAASLEAPPPEPGFGVAVIRSYDAMLAQAPPLDPLAPSFQRGNAFFWFEELAKLYVVGSQGGSPRFHRLMTAAKLDVGSLEELTSSPGWLGLEVPELEDAFDGLRSAKTALGEFLPADRGGSLESIERIRGRRLTGATVEEIAPELVEAFPLQDFDEFLASLATGFVDNWIRFSEIALRGHSICGRIEDGEAEASREELLEELKTLEDEARGIIYGPSPTPRDVPRREALWRALNEVRTRLNRAG